MDSGCLWRGRVVSIQSLVESNPTILLSKLHTSEGDFLLNVLPAFCRPRWDFSTSNRDELIIRKSDWVMRGETHCGLL